MSPRPIRTRFAPSPTGYLHIGGARTALFNYLFAKTKKGKFILRVEDTDQERSRKDFEEFAVKSLDWLGLETDENPQQGGDFGPYRQSERLDIYNRYTEQLLTKSLAYPCFCTDAELQSKQERAKHLGIAYIYDGKCRGLSVQEVKKRKDAQQKFAIRFRTENTHILVQDLIQGPVKFDARLIGDFIIVKSNSFPSYNYAVVIDDYEMQISHVIRGVGHLSNTPRQILLHNALELPLPCYAHIAEIVGSDRKKLSKRRGATSVLLFRDLGYLAPAFTNYMALLGWYPKDGLEFMPDTQLEQKFALEHCSKSPAMFDFFLTEKNERGQGPRTSQNLAQEQDLEELSIEDIKKNSNKKSKLNWLNNLYLREIPLESLWEQLRLRIMKDKELADILTSNEDKLKRGFDEIRKYLKTLPEALPYLKELFAKDIQLSTEQAKSILAEELSQSVCSNFLEQLQSDKPQSPEAFSQLMQQVGEKNKTKGRGLFMPIRIASTGNTEGLELPILFSLLGYETLISRLKSTLKL